MVTLWFAKAAAAGFYCLLLEGTYCTWKLVLSDGGCCSVLDGSTAVDTLCSSILTHNCCSVVEGCTAVDTLCSSIPVLLIYTYVGFPRMTLQQLRFGCCWQPELTRILYLLHAS